MVAAVARAMASLFLPVELRRKHGNRTRPSPGERVSVTVWRDVCEGKMTNEALPSNSWRQPRSGDQELLLWKPPGSGPGRAAAHGSLCKM